MTVISDSYDSLVQAFDHRANYLWKLITKEIFFFLRSKRLRMLTVGLLRLCDETEPEHLSDLTECPIPVLALTAGLLLQTLWVLP